MTTLARQRAGPPGSILDGLDKWIRSINRTYAPAVAFLVAVVVLGVAAFFLLPSLLVEAWGVDPAWMLGGRLSLAFGSIPVVAALFGVANLFLTLLGVEAVNVAVPIPGPPGPDWMRPRGGLPWLLGLL